MFRNSAGNAVIFLVTMFEELRPRDRHVVGLMMTSHWTGETSVRGVVRACGS